MRRHRREHAEVEPQHLELGAVVEELRQLDINSLTPLDALTKLYALQKQVRGEAEGAEG